MPIPVAIDFDGTIAEHEFPAIGEPVPDAFYWMRRWQEEGAKLILWTMRDDNRVDDGSPENGPVLNQAVEFCRRHGIEFWGINRNPEQGSWSGSPKAYASVYVDDLAFGCPLLEGKNGRPVVNWSVVGPAVLRMILEAKAKKAK
jgi:hypothetical protein